MKKTSTLLAELVRQHTTIEIHHDHEEGFFLKWPKYDVLGAMVVMDNNLSAVNTFDEAVLAAVEYHNKLCKKPHHTWLKPIQLQ